MNAIDVFSKSTIFTDDAHLKAIASKHVITLAKKVHKKSELVRKEPPKTVDFTYTFTNMQLDPFSLGLSALEENPSTRKRAKTEGDLSSPNPKPLFILSILKEGNDEKTNNPSE